MIPFPAFEPDRAPYNLNSSDQMINVLPAADGYKPMPTLREVSEALDDECIGAFSVSNNGGFAFIAGTRNKLFRLNTSITPNVWNDVSRDEGYDVPNGDRWTFAVFGDQIIACQLGGPPQAVSISSADKFADIEGAPTARTVWVSGDFLVFGHLSEQPNAIQWSGLNDMNHWVTGRKGSDIQTFPDGGEVMNGFGGQTGGIVMQRDKIRYMNFSPQSSYTFTFSEANAERGVLAPNSVAKIGPGRFLYLCKDGFFAGVEGNPIGATRVDEWFFNEVDHNNLVNVHAVVDPFEKIAWWIYRTSNETYKLIGYDWQLDRWCQSDQDVRAAVSLLTPGITWDGLGDGGQAVDDYDVSFDSRLFYGGSPVLAGVSNVQQKIEDYIELIDDLDTPIDAGLSEHANGEDNSIDAFSTPFDSDLFVGGSPVFAGFNADNKMGFMNGRSARAVLETPSVELAQGGRSFVTSARVVSDVVIDANAPCVCLNIGSSDHHGQNMSYQNDVVPSPRTGKIPLRSSGRLHRFKLTLDAGAAWTSVSAIVPEFTPEGQQ